MTNPTVSHSQIPQEEVDRKIKADFLYWCGEAVRDTPDEDGKRVKWSGFDHITPSLSAYLVARAAERQEAVLEEVSAETKIMREHSDRMSRESKVMIWLSITMTVLVFVQIIIALCKC